MMWKKIELEHMRDGGFVIRVVVEGRTPIEKTFSAMEEVKEFLEGILKGEEGDARVLSS